MIYAEKIREALGFAIEAHETRIRQKRKGKDLPYILHPLVVSLIVAGAGASEPVIVAGLLHDTVEDTGASIDEILVRFGPEVAALVDAVSVVNAGRSWIERSEETLDRASSFSRGAVLVKSADMLANDWELLDDYRNDGEGVFDRFNAGKEDRLHHRTALIDALLDRWPDSPLAVDLQTLREQLQLLRESKAED
jgi:(p)ppGpp synthase/HD superfamily hydrolase